MIHTPNMRAAAVAPAALMSTRLDSCACAAEYVKSLIDAVGMCIDTYKSGVERNPTLAAATGELHLAQSLLNLATEQTQLIEDLTCELSSEAMRLNV